MLVHASPFFRDCHQKMRVLSLSKRTLRRISCVFRSHIIRVYSLKPSAFSLVEHKKSLFDDSHYDNYCSAFDVFCFFIVMAL